VADCATMRAVAKEMQPELLTWCCSECHGGVGQHRVTKGVFIHRETHLCCEMWRTAQRLVEGDRG
jgi:hypothetical protein